MNILINLMQLIGVIGLMAIVVLALVSFVSMMAEWVYERKIDLAMTEARKTANIKKSGYK